MSLYKHLLTPALLERKALLERMAECTKTIAHETTFRTIDAVSGFTFVRSQIRKDLLGVESELAERTAMFGEQEEISDVA